MSDKELLELAAKAAGIEITWEHGQEYPERITPFRGHLLNYEPWNPLTNDGDALRLAVKLRMTVITLSDSIEVNSYDNHHCGQEMTTGGQDPYAATRRAIVRAAAEIGKAATK